MIDQRPRPLDAIVDGLMWIGLKVVVCAPFDIGILSIIIDGCSNFYRYESPKFHCIDASSVTGLAILKDPMRLLVIAHVFSSQRCFEPG